MADAFQTNLANYMNMYGQAMQGAQAPLPSAFGPTQVDASAYAPIKTGTPWDILLQGLAQNEYKTALTQAQQNAADLQAAQQKYKEDVARREFALKGAVEEQSAAAKAETEKAKTKADYQQRVAVADQWLPMQLQAAGVPDDQIAVALNAYVNGDVKLSDILPKKDGLGQGLSDLAAALAEGRSPITAKPTLNEIEKQQLGAAGQAASLKRMRQDAEAIPDSYWTVQGRVTGTVEDYLAKLGKPRDPKDLAAYNKFQRLIQSAGQNFDAYRKDVTGAAAATSELNMLKPRLPVADGFINFDSRPVFFQKLKSQEDFVNATQKRLADIKAKGFEIVSQQGDEDLLAQDANGNVVNVATDFPLSDYGFDTAAEGGSPFPAYPDAKQAPDGNWYVTKGGKTYLIKE